VCLSTEPEERYIILLPSVDSVIFKFFEVPSQARVYQMLVDELDTKQSQASYVSENAEIDKNTAACLDEALKVVSNQ
jgi:hypothetical protein